ncbi:MAG: hypothetical protein II857_11105, partial [Selenomonadaceae bacterium]|nr:hypothetical protein [Selenomonadaceae bacterium]
IKFLSLFVKLMPLPLMVAKVKIPFVVRKERVPLECKERGGTPVFNDGAQELFILFFVGHYSKTPPLS